MYMQTAPVERLSVGRLSCPRYEEPTPQTVNQGRRFVVNQFRASPSRRIWTSAHKIQLRKVRGGGCACRGPRVSVAVQRHSDVVGSRTVSRFTLRFPDRRLDFGASFGASKRPEVFTNLLRQVLRMGDFGAHVRAPLSRAPPCLSPAALSPKAGWPTLTRTSARDSSALSHYRPFLTPRGTLTRPRPSPSPPCAHSTPLRP